MIQKTPPSVHPGTPERSGLSPTDIMRLRIAEHRARRRMGLRRDHHAGPRHLADILPELLARILDDSREGAA